MSGPPLRVLVAHRPPLAFADAANGTQPIFTGYLMDLLPTLLQQAGVQQGYEMYPFQGPGGKLLSNGSWTGVMGELVTGHADMALFPLTLTTQRTQYIQSTQPFMDDGYGILIKTRQIDTGYSFLLPFQPLTWVLFLLALFAVMGIISILDSITRRARLRAIERTHGVIRGQSVRKRDKLMGHAIETVMMAVGSGAAPTSRSCSVKVMFVAWAIFCVIMLSAYTANLTANLTVNQMGVTIKSLSDLADQPLPFGVPAESSVAAYFANSSDQGARSLRPKMMEYTDQAQAVQAVREGRLSAFINDYPTVQFFTQEPPCDLALGAETIGSGALVIGLSPNSTLTQKLNSALLQLSEAGYLAELRRKWFVEASKCAGQDSANAQGDGRVSVDQAWSVFLILAGGAGIAFVVALFEVLYYKKIFSGVQELKHDMSSLGTRQALKKRVSRSKNIPRNVNFSGTISYDLENPDPSISPSGGSCTAQHAPSLAAISIASGKTAATDKDVLSPSIQLASCKHGHGNHTVKEDTVVGKPAVGSIKSKNALDHAVSFDDTAAEFDAGVVQQQQQQHGSPRQQRQQQQQQQQQPTLTSELLQQAQQQHGQQQQQQGRQHRLGTPFAADKAADWCSDSSSE